MPSPEKQLPQEFKNIKVPEKKPKSEPITSEQQEQVRGEIGESKINPIEYFEGEIKKLGKEYTEVFGPGMTIEKWNKNAGEHAEKRKKLFEIIKGLREDKSEAVDEAIDYLLGKMRDKEKELQPNVKEEAELNKKIDQMKSQELGGEKDFGYLKFSAKNQELDNLYAKLKKEREMAEPSKFKITDLELDIGAVEYNRDNTEYGKAAKKLRFIQDNIERINLERNKLDMLIRRLQEKTG